VEIALATCDPFTSSAARAAALGRLSLSLPRPGGDVSVRLGPGLLLSRTLAPPKPVPAPNRAGGPYGRVGDDKDRLEIFRHTE
jgi:hypothetical protein